MTIISDRLEIIRPADSVPGPKQGNWTYDSYAALPDDGQRYEIVDGVLYMAPGPSDDHQNASLLLSHYFAQHVQLTGLGKVRTAPYDVVLASGTVVEPDLIVVLNAHLGIITRKGVFGTPDLVLEIASPSTSTYDRNKKFMTYQKAGVLEYWIVEPELHTIEVWVLQNGVYQPLGIFTGKAGIPSTIVPSIAEIQVEQFFA